MWGRDTLVTWNCWNHNGNHPDSNEVVLLIRLGMHQLFIYTTAMKLLSAPLKKQKNKTNLTEYWRGLFTGISTRHFTILIISVEVHRGKNSAQSKPIVSVACIQIRGKPRAQSQVFVFRSTRTHAPPGGWRWQRMFRLIHDKLRLPLLPDISRPSHMHYDAHGPG